MSGFIITLILSSAAALFIYYAGHKVRPHNAGLTSGRPNQIPVLSPSMKKLRKISARIYDGKAIDPVSEKEKLEALLREVQREQPADYPGALLAMSEAMASLGDRQAQSRYLLEAESKLQFAETIVASTILTDLAVNYHYGLGVVPDDVKAFEYLKKNYELCAKSGAFPMGLAALGGIGTERDLGMTASCFTESDNMQRWPLIYAINYYLDQLTEGSAVEEAWTAYLKAYELIEFGHLYEEAIPYIEKAMQAAFLPAFQLLGDIRINSGDHAGAIEAVETAAAAGYVPAIHQKAYYIYSQTYGRLFQWKNIRQGYNLFHEAALAGYPASQVTVANFHIAGSGGVVPQDLLQACAFARAAADAGERQGEQMYETAMRLAELKELTEPLSALQGLHKSNALFRIAIIYRNMMNGTPDPAEITPSDYGIRPVPPLHIDC